MSNNYTPDDHRFARAMHVALDARESHEAAVDRLYNTLAVAYQRLDGECARAHQAARKEAEKCAAKGIVIAWLVGALVGALLFALVELAVLKGWVKL